MVCDTNGVSEQAGKMSKKKEVKKKKHDNQVNFKLNSIKRIRLRVLFLCKSKRESPIKKIPNPNLQT
ncbi:hypothetical protein DCO46_19695 [Flavobacterium sp. HTF]|nr:hypothetical protein DCO46_19695 [Flavobacterium sp. HTF]